MDPNHEPSHPVAPGQSVQPGHSVHPNAIGDTPTTPLTTQPPTMATPHAPTTNTPKLHPHTSSIDPPHGFVDPQAAVPTPQPPAQPRTNLTTTVNHMAQDPTLIQPNNETPPHIDQPNLTVQKPKRGLSKALAGFLGVFGALILLGGGAAAYQFLVVLPNTPDNTVARAFGNVFTEDSTGGDFVMGLNLDYSDQNALLRSMDLGITMSSDVPEGDSNTAAMSFGIPTLGLNFGQDLSPYSFDVTNSDMQIDVRLIGDNGYAKFSGMNSMKPAISSYYKGYTEYVYGQYNSYNYYDESSSQISDAQMDREINAVMDELQKYEDTWFEFDASGEDLNVQSDVNSTDLIGCLDTSQNSNLANELQDRYVDSRFLIVNEEYEKTTVFGDEVRHFLVDFKVAEFKTFATNVSQDIKNDQAVYGCLEDAVPGITGVLDSIIEADESEADDIQIEMWVDGDKKLRQVKYVYEENGDKAEIMLGMTFRDANAIETPDNTQKLNELVTFGDPVEDDLSSVLGETSDAENEEQSDEEVVENAKPLPPEFSLPGIWGEVSDIILP